MFSGPVQSMGQGNAYPLPINLLVGDWDVVFESAKRSRLLNILRAPISQPERRSLFLAAFP